MRDGIYHFGGFRNKKLGTFTFGFSPIGFTVWKWMIVDAIGRQWGTWGNVINVNKIFHLARPSPNNHYVQNPFITVKIFFELIACQFKIKNASNCNENLIQSNSWKVPVAVHRHLGLKTTPQCEILKSLFVSTTVVHSHIFLTFTRWLLKSQTQFQIFFQSLKFKQYRAKINIHNHSQR